MQANDVNGEPDPLLKRSGWRTEVELRCREIENRLAIAKAERGGAGQPPQGTVAEKIEATAAATEVTVLIKPAEPPASRELSDEARTLHEQAVEQAVKSARKTINAPRSLGGWWNGTAITMGWESVHNAEADLFEIESDEVVRASLPRLLTWIRRIMVETDLRDRHVKQLTDQIQASGGRIDRTAVRQAQLDATLANNEHHAALRAFRNLLICASAALGTLLVVVAVWHALNPNFVSLCGTSARDKTTECVTGSTPSGRDVFEIELVGALGGLLSVAFALGGTRNTPPRYNVRGAQAALKPMAGAATGLVGVLLVQSHILVAPAETVSESLLIAYAAVFGFSQQLLTQFVDKRAGKLLDPDDKPETDVKA